MNHAIAEENMANDMAQFCEQLSPNLLEQIKYTPSSAEMKRVQDSWVAAGERRALLWLAQRAPRCVSPDHLTLLGLIAQLGAGCFYLLARWNQFALVAVTLCLAANWLGDSLDGTLARVRQRLRPRYGFYVDHMVDTFGALGLMGGLAFSGYMSPWIAVGLLVAFLVLSVQSYLATQAFGEFRLSFWRFGPTELRILLAVGNLALLWKPRVHFLGESRNLFDLGGVIGLAGMALIVVTVSLQNTVRLYREERLSK
jgi:archaetidylinositol phosphate synthase